MSARAWIERLVSFDTTSRNSNLPLIDDVEAFLAPLADEMRRTPDDTGEKSNLLVRFGPEIEGGVVLSGHTDVVPVDGQDWSSDPFTVEERDGRLYGRGTADMKSFLAVALANAEGFAAAELTRPVYFAFSYDEEIGLLGAPRLIDDLVRCEPKPEAVIVGEPTMMKVIDGHKGIAYHRVRVTGAESHSSQTGRGVSAVTAAARLIGVVEAMNRARAANADPQSPFDPPHTTMTCNLVHGGTQANIMAGACEFQWDLRRMPGEPGEAALAEFMEHARALEAEMRAIDPRCAIEVERAADAPPLEPRAENKAAELAYALTGENRAGAVSYGTEGGQFQEAGLAVVVCGPGSIDQAHQPDEFISVDQLKAGDLFMKRLIKRLSG